jgi:NAD(P)-dependent dehydrogenase (short-subunit alcohol dehydrogenase family)
MSRTILITGASTGFGRDTALTLASAGYRVFASMRDVDGRNSANAEALRAAGIDVLELDVTDDASVERAVALLLASTDRLDVLVNNAGIGAAGISEAFTAEQLRALLDVNVVGVQRTLRAVLPTFRRQGEGLVVNVGSVLGRTTFPFFGLYGATKFALEALTDSYRYELSQLGIDVALVQPSYYPTNIFASALAPADAMRGASYGDVGAIPGKMVESVLATFEGEAAPDPHDVAEAIARLVAQPAGTRPARVVVGQAPGVEALNAEAAKAQTQVLASLGLSSLEHARVIAVAA